MADNQQTKIGDNAPLNPEKDTSPSTMEKAKQFTKNAFEAAKKVPPATYLSGLGYMIFLAGFIYFLIYKTSESTSQTQEINYVNDLYPSANGYIRPIDLDCSGNLYDYYIKTAYNCCSGGKMKSDYVELDVLKAVLKTGVRCLDFEIFNIDNEPVVATSVSDSYYVKETFNFISFSEVMDLLNMYAFSSGNTPNPTDPLLLHLRFKSNSQTMFSNLAKLFKNYPLIMLGKEYSYENEGKNIGATPLLELKGKIMVIIDKSNPAFLENEDLMEYVNLTSTSMFMRTYRYSKVKNVADLQELQEYNKKNLTIVLPDNEINPTNPNGILCREAGCQMVAMRYQYVDNYLEENALFFDDAGLAFVLKPDELRYHEVTIPPPTAQNPDWSYETTPITSDYYDFNI
jgi:hypothetical protein